MSYKSVCSSVVVKQNKLSMDGSVGGLWELIESELTVFLNIQKNSLFSKM